MRDVSLTLLFQTESLCDTLSRLDNAMRYLLDTATYYDLLDGSFCATSLLYPYHYLPRPSRIYSRLLTMMTL